MIWRKEWIEEIDSWLGRDRTTPDVAVPRHQLGAMVSAMRTSDPYESAICELARGMECPDMTPSELVSKAIITMNTRDAEEKAALSIVASLNARIAELERPMPMRLPCEGCGELHIDEGEFASKAHHTHSCQFCGLTWRPAIGPTVGVRFLPGFRAAPDPLSDPLVARMFWALDGLALEFRRAGSPAELSRAVLDEVIDAWNAMGSK